MSTYVYNCRECEKFIEVQRRMSDDEIVPECSSCSKPMGRVYSSAPVMFKATGFYKTDN
jgi:putative FmdB family regulatory protein